MKGYTEITQEIINRLQQGTIPWRQTWKSGLPCNAISRQPYRGVNWILLSNHNYHSNLWLTFNQTKQLGGYIHRGEHGIHIIYWNITEKLCLDELGEEYVDKVPLMRTYTVFNIEQTSVNIEDKVRSCDPIAGAQAIVDGYQGAPEIIPGEPAYSPLLDKVMIPAMTSFDSTDAYYSTLFHELSHSTGHSSRLNRPIKNHYGSDPYAEEELVAEMSAAYLSGIAGVDIHAKTIDNAASYIEHWSSRFSDNVKLIISLSSRAQKSSDWILGNRYDHVDNQTPAD